MEEEEEKAKKKKSIVMHSKTAATFLPLFPLFSLFPLSLFSLFSLSLVAQVYFFGGSTLSPFVACRVFTKKEERSVRTH